MHWWVLISSFHYTSNRWSVEGKVWPSVCFGPLECVYTCIFILFEHHGMILSSGSDIVPRWLLDLSLSPRTFPLYGFCSEKSDESQLGYLPHPVGVLQNQQNVRPIGPYLLDFYCSGVQFYVLLSPYLCFISFLYLDLYVLGDYAWISKGSFMQSKH